MTIADKAGNRQRYDFTEIVRFEIEDDSMYTESDVNKDGQINILDLIIVAQALGTQNTEADVNNDGTVSILDLVAIANEINEDVIAAPIYATQNQIETILSNVSQADDGSRAFRTALHVLQNLLRKMQPDTTALLPNYPNPFNPETWIPYQLAKPAEVRLSIYAADGELVRQLELGNQDAGIYQSRSRAVYWDGKNQIGESVSSGLYFYSLTAGEFSATRRMLIIK